MMTGGSGREDAVSVRAFCPAHITGFFTTHIVDDPIRCGSTGAGFTIDAGAVTHVEPADGTEVIQDGEPIDAITTLRALELLGAPPLKVHTGWGLPVGAGLSASGAGALSSVIAANVSLGMGHPYSRLVAAAHVAEVQMRTGLGCIAVQSTGGLVVRLAPGLPLAVDRITAPEKKIYIASMGRLSTPEVLSDDAARREITGNGRRALSALLKNPTFDEFIKQSRWFATETGLMDGRTLDAVEAVEAAGGKASMAMLGYTIFSTSPDGMENLADIRECRISSLPACIMPKNARVLKPGRQ